MSSSRDKDPESQISVGEVWSCRHGRAPTWMIFVQRGQCRAASEGTIASFTVTKYFSVIHAGQRPLIPAVDAVRVISRRVKPLLSHKETTVVRDRCVKSILQHLKVTHESQ